MKKYYLFLIVLFCLPLATLYAGNIDLTQRLYGKNSITNGATMRVYDNTRQALLSNIYNKTYSARVMLSYNRHGRTDLGPISTGAYWCREVTYTIEFFDDNQLRLGNPVTGNKLKISSDGSPVYEAVHVFNQSELNAGYALVTITNVVDNTCAGIVPDDIVMELTIRENVTFWMPSSNGFVVEKDAGDMLYWSYCHGAESYDVEWVYYDEKSPEPSAANRFLEKEPVRVNTKNQHYKLNLTYPKGKVYCRVRGVGKYLGSTGESTDKYTDWVYPSPDYIDITTSFEKDKNWQYVTSYAEEAKNKKVITYYDGTLRNRQVQTNISSDSTVLIAETKYDHEGRGVVNILPVPIKTSSLSYRDNFNTFTNGKRAYDTDFDPAFGALTSQQPGLTTTSEARKYYSNSNTVENTNRNYLPESNGYGYTLTQYMEDGTGRIARQSGVGEVFRLKHPDSLNHYTRYLYGTPNETELRRLFGSNIGEISHYQKNAVVDPNGQVSVSYLDMHDRVIATALAGNAPSTLLPIPSNKIETLTVSLDGTNVIDTNNFISSSVNKIVNVVSNTSYHLKYSLNGVINQTADFYGLCKTCKYDLEIRVLNERGSNFCTPIIRKNIAPASYTCPANQSFSKLDLVDTTLLFQQIGTYTIYKKLTLSSGYIDTMLTTISTLPGFPDSTVYITQGIQMVDTTMCGFACEDHPSTTNEECSGDLAYKYTCASLLGQMKAQLLPGGHYNDNGTAMAACSTAAVATGWGGAPSLSDLMNDALFREKNLELNDAWINNLVKGHPEYCHYTTCLLDSTSRNYDLRMAAIPDWTTAVSGGYLDPLNYTITSLRDPFFEGIGSAYKTSMQNSLMNYVANKLLSTSLFPDFSGPGNTSNSNPGDLWDFVSNARLYFTDPINFFYIPTDQEKWRTFHAIYLGLKQTYVKQWRDAFCPDPLYLHQPYAVVKDPFDYMPGTINDLGNAITNAFNAACADSTQCKQNVKLWMKLLESKCSTPTVDHITGADSIAVANYLYAYCDSTCGRFNPFHLLIAEHKTPGSKLALADAILQTHSCTIDHITVGNPYTDTCVADYITPQEEILCSCCFFGCSDPPPNYPEPLGEICFVTGINCELGDHCNDSIVDLEEEKKKCIALQKAIGRANGLMLWQQAVDQFRATVLKKYYNKCFSNPFAEHFNYSYNHQEYHYTLYYYDQAGNLTQTVPPAGVNPLKTTAFDTLGRYISGNEPYHYLITKYRYNTLEQLLWQDTPDADSTLFFYDSKGQLRLSQNAKQKAISASATANVYSYTNYDEQGRIIEVGQVRAHDKTATYMADHNKFKEVLAILDNTAFPEAAKGLREKTITDYDLNLSGSFENLRGRVARVSTIFTEGSSTAEAITSYSYDPHGNVKKLIQQINGFGSKVTEYDYDLISGKVNKVFYQKGQADQFTHVYRYDADNRIVSVQTSSDNQIWSEDARYFYYKHGPLARVELGRDKVQGLDYYYTLQGWLKGVNVPDTMRTYAAGQFRVLNDPGHDGIALNGATPYQSGTAVAAARHLNRFVAQDEFAFTLGYYNGDHISIHSHGQKGLGSNMIFTSSNPVSSGIRSDSLGLKGLFNGNIPMMLTQVNSLGTLPGFSNEKNFGIRANAYQYDQLNRLREARSVTHNNSGTSGWASRTNTINSAAFDARYSYDPNGNIDSARVNGATASLMDDLKYHYDEFVDTDSKIWYRSNRLYHVNDAVGASSGPDLGNQGSFTASATNPYELTPSPGTINSSNNYRYDPIGNLIHDSAEEIETIEWTVYGKVKSVIRTVGSTKANLDFVYDGAGNRIAKIVTPAGGGNVVTTYYLRDASGNVMATYESSLSNYNLEYPVYGSSRVGMYSRTSAPTAPAAMGPYTSNSYVYMPTQREYELSNHLGNVYVTTSGLKYGVDTTSDGKADYYRADVKSANDFYPFGMSIGSRSLVPSDKYRYGFNAKENDGETGWQDYGERMYNPKLSRFFSVDPITAQYPWYTPYQFTGDNPVRYVDLDGKEPAYLDPRTNNFVPASDHLQRPVPANARFLPTSVKFETPIAVDIMVGMTPAGPVMDGADFLKAANEGDGWGMVGAGVGIIPLAGDWGKNAIKLMRKNAGDVTEETISTVNKINKTESLPVTNPTTNTPPPSKTDFIVTPDGVAVPKDQKVMREGFDNAGFPSRPATETSEKGVIHTVPTSNGKVDVRTMEGSAKHTKRAVITHPNTNNPKTPSGKATNDKKDNHIQQH